MNGNVAEGCGSDRVPTNTLQGTKVNFLVGYRSSGCILASSERTQENFPPHWITQSLQKFNVLSCMINGEMRIHPTRIPPLKNQNPPPNPKPQTPNSKLQTPNPKLRTQNRKPQNPKLKPQTPKPKPKNQNLKRVRCEAGVVTSLIRLNANP